MLVGEAGKGKSCESGGGNQRRIEEDQAGLGQKTVLCNGMMSVSDLEGGAIGSRRGRARGLGGIAPNIMRPAPKVAVMVRQPTALRVRNMQGASKTPQMAGNIRMAT